MIGLDDIGKGFNNIVGMFDGWYDKGYFIYALAGLLLLGILLFFS